MRAPYISMNAENDFQLYPPTSEELLGLNKDFNPIFYERTESVFIPKEKIFPDPPKETSSSLRDLLEAQNALSSIERPQDKQILSMKRPLDKSSLEKGPPAKMFKRETGPHTSPKAKSSFDSVLLNLLLTGEDKQYGYTTKDLKSPKVPKVTIAQPRAAPNISQPQRTILPGEDLWYTLKMMTPDVSM